MLHQDVNTIIENAITCDSSGSGAFSEVFILPGDKQAVKVCRHANSDAWLAYAIYCLQNQGKELIPVIHGIKVDYLENIYVAVLDKLEEVHYSCADKELSKRWSDTYDDADIEAAAYSAVRAVNEMMPGYVRATDDIEKHHNWMWNEDETPFMTDPMCYRGWDDMKEAGYDRGVLLHLMDYCEDNSVQGIEFCNLP